MNIIFIAFLLSQIILLLIVMYLDNWSTVTLFAVQLLKINDPKLSEAFEERDKKEGPAGYEMNVIARKFMNKFGIRKGLVIFTFVIRYPLFGSIVVMWYFGYLYDAYMYGFAMFYLGIIFSQIIRAYWYTQFIKKNLGINIKKYGKENLK